MPKITNPADRRVAVNVSLTVGMLEQLDKFVEEHGLSRSAFIRSLVEAGLEDAVDVAVSEERLKEPRIPWETVKAEAEL